MATMKQLWWLDKDKIDPEKTNIICPVINTGDEH